MISIIEKPRWLLLARRDFEFALLRCRFISSPLQTASGPRGLPLHVQGECRKH